MTVGGSQALPLEPGRRASMPSFRIVCTVQLPAGQQPTHAHIVEIGTGDNPAMPTLRWSVAEVVAAIQQGNTFYTESPSTGRRALVEPFWCPFCFRQTLRSAPDTVRDNNLDALHYCPWAA